MRKTSIAVTSSKRITKFSPTRQRLLLALLAFSSLTSGGAALAGGGALPTGGHFVGGSGAITQGGNHLTVNQSTQLGIINWQSFSIGKGNSVTIDNGRGATLNRVTGGDMSTIAGSLKSTGSVYIVNQAGVVVGPSGKVTTNGSFVASTRDVSNSAFMAGGKMEFSGNSSGTVDNQGSITSSNGDVVLVGKSVSNSGTVSAANGGATLAAGDKVLLQVSGDDAVLVQAGSGDVTNTGTIQAAQVALNAKGGNVYALAVNDGGVIRATGTATRDGHVYLTGGDDVTVAGAVTATDANGSGGTVEVTGQNVKIAAKTRISADGTGKAAGGTVLIGGDRHGGANRSEDLSKKTVTNAQTTAVAATASISADGGGSGNGGNVVIWSDQTTNFAGHISAKGGASGGNGGQVEVSSEGLLGFTGRVSTLARRGKTGMLLIDPADVTIYSSTDSNHPTPSSSFILNTTIDTMLASNNVTIDTSGSGGNGDIHIGTNGGSGGSNAAPIFWSSGNSLTLNADRLIDMPGGNPGASTGGANPGAPGILINSLGSGAITLTAGGAGLTPAATVISITGDIAAHGGTISFLSTSSTYRIEGGNGQTISNTADNGAGKIVFQADEVRLGTGSGPTTQVITPGEVDIVPTTAGAVVVGDIDPTGAFYNDDNTALIRSEDVINITADLLVIGSTSTTTLSFQTANPTGETNGTNLGLAVFDAAFVNKLKLVTSATGTVTQDATTGILVNDSLGTTTTGAGGLAIQTGTIALNSTANSVGTIAFNTTGGDISFATAPSPTNTLVVGTVAGISGISTSGGAHAVTLAVNGDAVTQASGAANAIAPTSGTLDLELTTTAGGAVSSFTLDNPANAVTTVGANVSALTLYSNVDLGTGTVGSTTGVTGTGDVTIVDNGQLTIGSGAGIGTTGGNIRVEDQTFVSSDAGSAFSAGAGKTWRVYSQDPTQDSANTAALSYSFVQYGATNSYADPFSTADAALDSHASGNGFLYTVSPTAAVTLSGTFNKNYDGTNAVSQTIGNSAYGTVTGTINGDVVTFTSLSDSAATYSSKNAGTNLPITLSQTVAITSAVDSNDVTVYGYGSNITNNLKGTISPLAITLTAGDQSKTYGQTKNLGSTNFTITSGSLVGSESIDSATLTSLGAPATADAGSYNINISNASGSSGFLASNYDITYVKGTLTVNKAALTFTPNAASVVYDGTTLNNTTYSDDLGNYTITGFKNSDDAGNSGLTLTGSMAFSGSTGTTVKNVGTYSQGVGTLSLTSTNYTLTFTNPTPNNYVITPAALTITANDRTKTYGQTLTLGSTAFTTSGLAGSETIDSATLTSAGAPATADAGGYNVNISNASGSNGFLASNYDITYVKGTLTVNPAPLTITIGDRTKTYGQLINLGTTDFTTGTGQLKNGDQVTSVTLASTGTPKTANVGDYDITGSNPTGSGFNTSNYSVTYVTGTLTVDPAVLTFTPVAFQKVYDGNTLNNTSYSDDLGNYTITGYVNGQNATSAGISLSGSMAFDGSTTTVVKNAGTYSQGAGSLTLTSDHGNYVLNFTNPNPNNYVITPASVTLADISGTRVYDGTTNANGSYLTVTDLAHPGDQVSVAGIGVLASKDVGKEQIVDLGTLHLTGADAGNYTLSSSNPNDFVIVTKATLTVSAVTQTKVYDGTTTSNLTPTITGLQTGDSITGTKSQSYNSRDVLGTDGSTLTALHDIGVNDGNGGGNYKIVYVTAKGTITPEHVTVTASPNTKTYDGTTTATATPIVTSGVIYDPDTGHFTESYDTQHAGTGLTLTPTGSINDGNGGKNYIITYVPISGAHPGQGGKSGIINPAPLTISAVTQTKVYDGTVTSTETPIITAGELVGSDTLTNLSQSYNSKNVLGPNGSTLSVNSDYVLTNASDYKVTLLTAPGTITPLTISATGTRVYDSTTGVDGSILTITNLVGGDDVSIGGTGTSASEHVGTHNVTGGLTLTGGDAGNYTLVGGHETVKITPFAVVLYGTRVYDGDTDGDSAILAVTNAFKGDEVTVTSGTSTIVSKNVGNEKIADFGTLTLGGASAGDYTLVGATGIVKVTPEAITVTAVPGTKVYDGTDTSTGTPIVTSGTIFTGDTGDFIQTYGSQHAGTGITLTPSGPVNDGNGGKNYTITYVPITDGIITPRPVDLSGTRPFDGSTDANSTILTITNLVPGDVVTVDGTTGTVISPNVGPEKITDFTGLTLGGPSSGDYTLVGATGIVTITPGSSPNNNQIDNQTASGTGTQFNIASSGIITLEPRQNGVVTGTIATIDGTDYHPDSQLGCTLGQAGCIQNGVAPTNTSTPQ